jgi:hypothetical protein
VSTPVATRSRMGLSPTKRASVISPSSTNANAGGSWSTAAARRCVWTARAALVSSSTSPWLLAAIAARQPRSSGRTG